MKQKTRKYLITLLLIATFPFVFLGQNDTKETEIFEQTLGLIRKSTYMDSVIVFDAIKKIESIIKKDARKKSILHNRLGDFYFHSSNFNKAEEEYNLS